MCRITGFVCQAGVSASAPGSITNKAVLHRKNLLSMQDTRSALPANFFFHAIYDPLRALRLVCASTQTPELLYGFTRANGTTIPLVDLFLSPSLSSKASRVSRADRNLLRDTLHLMGSKTYREDILTFSYCPTRASVGRCFLVAGFQASVVVDVKAAGLDLIAG